MAVTALALGILGLCLGVLLALPALILGIVAYRRRPPGAQGMATTAIVLGAIGTVVGTLVVGVLVALVMDISNDLDNAPDMQFQQDHDARTLTVVSITPSETVTWWDVDVHGCQDRERGTIRPGDVLHGCRGDVYVQYVPTGEVIGSWRFDP